MDQEAKATKRFSVFPQSSKTKAALSKWFNVISRTVSWRVLPLCVKVVGAFYSLRSLGWWLKQFKSINVFAVIGSIVAVGTLTCCALFHSMCDLKAPQMNVQQGLIWELRLYEFKLVYNTADVIKNIYHTKGQDTADSSTDIFVTASHQIGLDTRSMTQRSIIVGI